VAVRRALVSVYDKTGLVPFVRRLVAAGYEIVSSGGTASVLREEGVDVTAVEAVTGAPEILGGRVKTLHPKIHGGILGRGESDDAELSAQEIDRFDLVVCNLYPFRETVADETATDDDIIEKIDIGGPAMVRAAAKNHHHVTVVVSPDQYEAVAAAIEAGGPEPAIRRRLAADAFFHTAAYDAAIVGWIGDDRVLSLRNAGTLRYGENPHQLASIYREDGAVPWWAVATQHQGKEMSFNNYADTEAAWRLATDLGDGSVVVVKHTNAAGAARGQSIAAAFEDAWDGDPLAAFGGVVAVNGELDQPTATAIAARFVEVVVARSATPEALDALAARPNVRVLTAPPPAPGDLDWRRIDGGMLTQERDRVDLDGWETVSERAPDPDELDGLRFAWVVVAHTKSNAIVISQGPKAVAVGAGDQSRVGAAQRAVVKAGDRARGGVAASDAFFPFRDGLDALAEAGVTAVVEPGGSVNDQEVIDAADEHGLALVFTNRRHFRH
jgi:phosphoribosylaminoimidazolecarboxamide formyltransferase / IMP cyclohydrolase